jgi:hypothetical protein
MYIEAEPDNLTQKFISLSFLDTRLLKIEDTHV